MKKPRNSLDSGRWIMVLFLAFRDEEELNFGDISKLVSSCAILVGLLLLHLQKLLEGLSLVFYLLVFSINLLVDSEHFWIVDVGGKIFFIDA
jgi:hypothetical protein